MNLAQDFSPGTASELNDLVPEARLSSRSTEQFSRSYPGFHTVPGFEGWRGRGERFALRIHRLGRLRAVGLPVITMQRNLNK